MKKITSAILLLAAMLLILPSCEDENINLASRVSLSQTEEVEIAAENATPFVFEVNSDGDWLVVVPAWIKATPRYGSGNGAVTLTFEDNYSYVYDEEGNVDREMNGVRHGKVSIECASGATSFIVCQEGDPDKPSDEIRAITVAEFNALPDGAQLYELTGTVTRIANTTYGNLYLNDGTAEIYIYGILDLEGQPKKFGTLGISVGDLLTVHGAKTTYNNAPEIVNAQYISHAKSILSVAETAKNVGSQGEDFSIGVSYTGDLKVVSDAQWLSFTGISTVEGGTVLNFTAAANEEGAREGKITVTATSGSTVASQEIKVTQAGGISGGGDVITISVQEFLAVPESGTQKYQLTGTISGTINTTYGNFDLVDDTGTVYVYGLTATELGYGASNDKSYASLGLAAGDKITIIGYRGSYNGKIEVLSAYFVSKQ